MGVDLFTLNLRLETSGLGVAKTELAGVETAAKSAALGATNFANAWEGAKLKFAGTAAELAAFKTQFSAGFFNEKMIAGMSLAGQEAEKAGQGAAKWAAGMANIRAQAEQQTRSLGPLGTALAHLAVIYGAFKFAEFVHGTIETAGALHEMSQRTGASVETLSALKFAGDQADVSVAQITTGFKGMAISLGNLRDGQDKTVEAYKRLGFSLKDFEGLSPDQTFVKLATAVGGMKDETERAEVAQRVFGRSGAALLPLLVDIAEKGFGAIQDEAERNGGIFSKEMADRADAFSDSVTRLKASFRVLLIEGLGPVLPVLTQIVDMIAKGAALLGQFAGPLEKSDAFKAGFRSVTGKDPDWKAFHEAGGFRGDESLMGKRAALPDVDLSPVSLTPPNKLPPPVKLPAAPALGDLGAQATMAPGVFAPDTLAGGGIPTIGTRGPLDISGSLQPGVQNRPGVRFMDTLKQDLFDGLQRLQPFAQGLQGFFSNLFTTGKIGTSLKQFGQNILAGMGSIFAQMAAKAIAAAPLFQAIGAAMRNPFTAGFALLAFGIALKALGASMGGTATGSGGESGGSFANQTTNVTLLPNGAGGLTAPERPVGPEVHVLGAGDPRAGRVLGEHVAAARRSRNM